MHCIQRQYLRSFPVTPQKHNDGDDEWWWGQSKLKQYEYIDLGCTSHTESKKQVKQLQREAKSRSRDSRRWGELRRCSAADCRIGTERLWVHKIQEDGIGLVELSLSSNELWCEREHALRSVPLNERLLLVHSRFRKRVKSCLEIWIDPSRSDIDFRKVISY